MSDGALSLRWEGGSAPAAEYCSAVSLLLDISAAAAAEDDDDDAPPGHPLLSTVPVSSCQLLLDESQVALLVCGVHLAKLSWAKADVHE